MNAETPLPKKITSPAEGQAPALEPTKPQNTGTSLSRLADAHPTPTTEPFAPTAQKSQPARVSAASEPPQRRLTEKLPAQREPAEGTGRTESEQVTAHLLNVVGDVDINDPEIGAIHGTSVEAIEVAKKTGRLPGRSQDDTREHTIEPRYLRGDLSVYPTPAIANVVDEIGSPAATERVNTNPEQSLVDATDYADFTAKKHYIMKALNIPLDTTDSDFTEGVDALVNANDPTYFVEQGLPTERIEELRTGALERKGVVVAIGTTFQQDPSLRLMKGDPGVEDLRIRTNGQGLSYEHLVTIDPQGTFEETKVQEWKQEFIDSERTRDFARITTMGYEIPTREDIPTYTDVAERFEIRQHEPSEITPFIILESLQARQNDGEPIDDAAFISAAAEVLRTNGYPEIAVDYATQVTIPSLIALHAGHASGYASTVTNFIEKMRDAEDPHTLATLQQETAEAIDFVENKPARIHAINKIFDAWMEQVRNGTIESNIIAIIQFGSYIRGDASYLSDVDAVIVSDGDVSPEELAEFSDYINTRIHEIMPSSKGLGIWRNGAQNAMTFPIEYLLNDMEESDIELRAPEYRQRITAVNDYTRHIIERDLSPLESQLEVLYGPERAAAYAYYLLDYTRTEEELINVEDVTNRLLRGEREIDAQLVSQLQALASEAREHPSDLVTQARSELREFFTRTDHESSYTSDVDYLRSLGYLLMYYGSIQFDDIKNLDADTLAVTLNSFINLYSDQNFRDIFQDFHDYWISLSRVQGNERGGPQLTPVNLADYNNIDLDNETDIGKIKDLSTVISGLPVYEEDRERVSMLQERARQIAESDPLYTAIVNSDLEDCLNTRLRRRAERATSATTETTIRPEPDTIRAIVTAAYAANPDVQAKDIIVPGAAPRTVRRYLTEVRGRVSTQLEPQERDALKDRVADAINNASSETSRREIATSLGILPMQLSRLEAELRGEGRITAPEAPTGRRMSERYRTILNQFKLEEGEGYKDYHTVRALNPGLTDEQFSTIVKGLRRQGFPIPFASFERPQQESD